eukprot:1153119-Pelagomonas_calceolata.AAC.9
MKAAQESGTHVHLVQLMRLSAAAALPSRGTSQAGATGPQGGTCDCRCQNETLHVHPPYTMGDPPLGQLWQRVAKSGGKRLSMCAPLFPL